jgi:predicted dithiol-disulfide oxidoreductase (DUF899 family)
MPTSTGTLVDYHAIMDDEIDTAAENVFTRRDGTMRHIWGAELGVESADPGKDPTTEPDLMELWNILDSTPDGRGTDWYPKITY